ncbi:restriction endonuclease subunit S [Bacillus halotolerans]|uniref:restriction endonuclease subunit S n=1 Tax=Bacillus halotolerans TaxID=260554 RepID=UPI00404946D0
MENKRVPELRFAGFAGDWEERKLGELVEIKSGWAPSDFVETQKCNGEIYIKVDDLNYSTRELLDSKMKVAIHAKYHTIKKGSTIFPKRGAAIMTNKVRVLGTDGYMDTNMMALEPRNIDGEFLYTLIDRTGLFKIADTSTIPQINNKHVEPYKILLPNLYEQKNIGNFFKQIDNTIALHQQELTTLKQTKQGFLQKMFPKEGESVPEVRFTGFKGEWEQRKLINEIIEKVLDYRGKSPTKFGMKWGNSGYLVLSALNVKDGYIDKRVEAKYGDQTLFERWMGKERLEKGDVVFTTEAPLGNVAQVPDDNGYILNQRAVAFKTSKEKTDNNFLAQLLRSPLFQTKLQAIASGGTAKGIGMKEFAKMSVNVPVLVEEQTKIGHFFKQLDDTITLHQRELDALKETKKAFLQKMFV